MATDESKDPYGREDSLPNRGSSTARRSFAITLRSECPALSLLPRLIFTLRQHTMYSRCAVIVPLRA